MSLSRNFAEFYTLKIKMIRIVKKSIHWGKMMNPFFPFSAYKLSIYFCLNVLFEIHQILVFMVKCVCGQQI